MALFSGSLGAKALRLVIPALVVMPAVACSSEQRPATVRPATGPSHVTPTQPTWMLVPSAERKKFLAALKAIDRPLAADGDEALTHAVDICFKSYDGTSGEALQTYARTAYSGGTVTISSAIARKIVTVTKKWICPSDALYRRWES